MPLPHSVASVPPSSPSAWQAHSFCWWHAHVWCGLEMPDYPDIKVFAWKEDTGAEEVLTNSTNPIICLHYLSHPDRSRSLEHSCKITQYLWRCQPYRRPRRTTIPCIWAFPDLVVFTSFSTDPGEVKICLCAYSLQNKQHIWVRNKWVQLVQMSNSFLKRPSRGSSGSYTPFS